MVKVVFAAAPTYATINKQGRIHGNPVADGWAGAVMRKTARNFRNISYRPTGRPTRQGVESRVRD